MASMEHSTLTLCSFWEQTSWSNQSLHSVTGPRPPGELDTCAPENLYVETCWTPWKSLICVLDWSWTSSADDNMLQMFRFVWVANMGNDWPEGCIIALTYLVCPSCAAVTPSRWADLCIVGEYWTAWRLSKEFHIVSCSVFFGNTQFNYWEGRSSCRYLPSCLPKPRLSYAHPYRRHCLCELLLVLELSLLALHNVAFPSSTTVNAHTFWVALSDAASLLFCVCSQQDKMKSGFLKLLNIEQDGLEDFDEEEMLCLWATRAIRARHCDILSIKEQSKWKMMCRWCLAYLCILTCKSPIWLLWAPVSKQMWLISQVAWAWCDSLTPTCHQNVQNIWGWWAHGNRIIVS